MIHYLIAALAVTATANLHATLFPVEHNLDVSFDSESFLVEYMIKNVGQEPTSFLPWKTPLDTVWEDIFLVVDAAGNEIPYTGKLARRVPVTPDQYVTMQPGEALHAVVDLTRSYLLPHDGNFQVSLRMLNTSLDTDAPRYVYANTLSMTFSNVHRQLERFQATDGMLGTDFTNCDSTQRSQTQSAWNTALNVQTRNARNCLASSSGPSCSVYTTWFGATTSSQYSTVRNCWANIERDLPSANFYCCPSGCGRNCGSGIYAYVYPSDRNMIHHLCQAFWDIPSERPETVTHEQSHFTVTCGTDDITYGRSSCMALARSSPSQAIRNADNHCFFGADAP